MMKCKNCGSELQPGIKFCPVCGTKAGRMCSGCGAEIDEEIKFCPNCGKEIREVGNEAVEEAGIENENDRPSTYGDDKDVHHAETGNLNAKMEIVGKHTEYYAGQFEKLQEGKKCKINWASFFLGIFHAAYRNVWVEWIKGPGIPQIASALVMLIGGGVLFITGNTTFMVPVMAVTIIAQIVGLVMHILFVCRFNRIYLKHVDEKVKKNDYSRDPSIPRAVLVPVAFGIVISICHGIYSAGSASAIMATVNVADGKEVSALLSESKKEIEKFAKKNRLVVDDDIGIYSNTGIMIIPNEDGTILTLSIMEPGYLLYGLEVGSRFLVPEDNGKLTMQGYTYLMTEGEEIIFGIPEKTGIQGASCII